MRFRMSGTGRIAVVAGLLVGASQAVADEGLSRDPKTLAIQASPGNAGRFPTSREHAGAPGSGSGSSASWWLIPLGLVLAGGAWGWIRLSSRGGTTGRKTAAVALEVVGRVSLGPRQTVCLVRVGDQVLIVGTGPQGPPSLMGELTGAEPEPTAGEATR